MLKNVKIWKVTVVVKPARKKVVCRLSGSPRQENTFESFQKVLTLPYFTGHNCQSCIVYLNLDHLKAKKSHLIQEYLISLSSLSLLLGFLLNNKLIDILTPFQQYESAQQYFDHDYISPRIFLTSRCSTLWRRLFFSRVTSSNWRKNSQLIDNAYTTKKSTIETSKKGSTCSCCDTTACFSLIRKVRCIKL